MTKAQPVIEQARPVVTQVGQQANERRPLVIAGAVTLLAVLLLRRRGKRKRAGATEA
jgi:hypothetical protein